ncbi:Transcriptional regulator, containings XRE-family HTH domain (plasmid) [Nostoc flagelliforme CCNUN1]|uniref:Transcriptional regulator, containings XRE-family HTH domain n=1 Tax=Nostoc flagelliforme CCNUN1 TaxID=2038116 RepID=A0A2K8TA01_9NOSO|nr:hypothetical protein [Nostoc flagelliforme]AUB44527.1 Transcriptional regulator, containings XRE-family HTH domain [Nostoc flagelliforme CCNUN1]
MLMDVVRQIKVTIPDLSQKIKEAREKDGRSVQVLATSAGISTAYWYQIEQKKDSGFLKKLCAGLNKL